MLAQNSLVINDLWLDLNIDTLQMTLQLMKYYNSGSEQIEKTFLFLNQFESMQEAIKSNKLIDLFQSFYKIEKYGYAFSYSRLLNNENINLQLSKFYKLAGEMKANLKVNKILGIKSAAINKVIDILYQNENSLSELYQSEIDRLNKIRERERNKPKSKPNGDVYIIKVTVNNTYKIGYSKKPKDRLQTLQTSTSNKLEFIHSKTVENPMLLEAKIHEEFNKQRLASEWFALTVNEIEIIKIKYLN